MRSTCIAVLLLAAIACAEMTPEDTMVSDDFQVPNELVESPATASALAETETDIASSSKTASAAKASAGFWRRRRRRLRCEEETLVQKADKKEAELVVARSGSKASAGFWRRRRRYVHPCQGVWNERAGKERTSKHHERVNKERSSKHHERVNKERANKERSNKERTAKERANKERANKERANKERANKERANKERANKERANKERANKNAERSNKERSNKERANKERSNKERANKVRAAQEKKSKEHRAKTVEKASKEKAGKEKSSKERSNKERTAKERNNKERAKKHELNNKEKAAKAREIRDKKAKKEKKAKADEKRAKELVNKERSSKERSGKERSKKAERNHKEKAHKEKGAKERAAKAKEVKAKGAKHKAAVHTAKIHHDHVTVQCKAHAKKTAKSGKSVTVHKSEVIKAVKEGTSTCAREKKRRAAAKAAKAKMEAHGPTFNFKSKPCKGGKGSFTRQMKRNERVTVGLIPANTHNVLVKLRTDKDVDAELWTASGKREIAIVAWMVGKINSPTKASIKFAGAEIEYSGYNGIKNKNGMNFGHENIGIKGQCKVGFTMKAFAFQSGVARINYTWGANPKKCEAAKAAKKKESKAKYAAKKALGHKMKEGKYKAALKVLSGGKGCKGSSKWTKSTKVRLSIAEAKHHGHKKAMALCHAKQNMSRKKYHALKAKLEAFKKKHN